MPPTRAELSERLPALARALGEPPLSSAEAEALAGYAELVARWNQRVDLTGAKTARDLVEVLLADALVMRDHALVPPGARVLDVGTGVGAPIIPLLLLRGDASAACYEPRRKRVAFLRTAIGELGLVGRMTVHEARIEPGGRAGTVLSEAAGATVASSRATFAPPAWLELGLTLAPRVLVFAAREALPAEPEGVALAAQRRYALPSSRSPRVLAAYARER